MCRGKPALREVEEKLQDLEFKRRSEKLCLFE